MGNVLAPDGGRVRRSRAGWAPPPGAAPCCATARTRTRPPRSTATRRTPRASPARRSCTARRCRTTTTSTPTPPGAPRTTTTAVCVAIIKHANPCGIAVGTDVAEVHRRAHACDPTSAFGGVIAANTEVSTAMAETVSEIFTEVIVAPSYADGAVEILARKKNIRVLTATWAPSPAEQRAISGGLLLQQRDAVDAPGDDPAHWTLACGDGGVAGAARRPRLRLARLPRGEVERDPARPRRRDDRRRHGAGQPRRRRQARRRPRRRPRRRLRRRLRRLLPVPGRVRGARRGRRRRRRPARRLGARRADDRGRAARPA